MKLLLLAPLLLAGCAYTPEMVTQMDDFNVCRLATGSPARDVANAEIARRDIDCRPYYQAIAEGKRANTAAALEALSAMPVYQPPAPRGFVSCSSTVSGPSVSTVCY